MEEDRRRAAMQKADTEFLARELAALRIALGEVATRDFLRSELNRLTEELDDAAQRRGRSERKELRAGPARAAKRPASDDAADFADLVDISGRALVEQEKPGEPTFELDTPREPREPRRPRRPPAKGDGRPSTGKAPRASRG